jgi:hypothetical protein
LNESCRDCKLTGKHKQKTPSPARNRTSAAAGSAATTVPQTKNSKSLKDTINTSASIKKITRQLRWVRPGLSRSSSHYDDLDDEQHEGRIRLIVSRDPKQTWSLLDMLGDGAFGKVYKARSNLNGSSAAAKIVEYCTRDDLEDYMTELDILFQCTHRNIVKIFEAYYFKLSLWVLKNIYGKHLD